MQSFKYNVLDEQYDLEKEDLIPSGHYAAEITIAEMRPTKANKEGKNDSENLYIEFMILSKGSHKNKVVRQWLAIHNPNEIAQQIARKKLKQLVLKLGISNVDSPEDLMGKSLTIDVGIESGPDGYKQNRVLKYMDYIPTSESKKDDFEDEVPF